MVCDKPVLSPLRVNGGRHVGTLVIHCADLVNPDNDLVYLTAV